MANYIKAPKSSIIYYDIPGVENNDRFKILNKLGYGAYSTVWLARDDVHNRLVALKVLRADASLVGAEAKLVDRLAGEAKVGVLPVPEECFKIEGPNGVHDVLEMPIAGPSIPQYIEQQEGHRLPVETRNKVIRDVVTGIACLHKVGIVHGDLYPSNILLRIPDDLLDNHEQLLACFSSPVSEPIMRMDGLPLTAHTPESVVHPAKPSLPGSFDGTIVIADFGSSFQSADDEGVASFSVYAPCAALERLLGGSYGLSSVIWLLACVIFQLVSGKALFEEGRNSPQMVLLHIFEVLGRPSEEWWLKWEECCARIGIARRDVT